MSEPTLTIAHGPISLTLTRLDGKLQVVSTNGAHKVTVELRAHDSTYEAIREWATPPVPPLSLDEQVAREVMGYERSVPRGDYWRRPGLVSIRVADYTPSTDFIAAQRALEHVMPDGAEWNAARMIHHNHDACGWRVWLTTGPTGDVDAPTLPEALCLLALEIARNAHM